VEKIVVAVFLVAFMFHAGLGCDYHDLLKALRNINCMLRIFAANFVVVPIIGLITIRVIPLDDFVAAGIILMAISPGVPFLPMIAGTKHGGDEGLATGLAVLLPAISVITVPITAPLVLPANAEAHIGLATFVTNLVALQLVPLLIGLYIRARAPSIAATLIKVAILIAVLALVVVSFGLVPKMGEAFASVYGSHGLLVTLLLIVLSAATGWLFGGSEVRIRNTITLSTIMRNFGLALAITGPSFPGTVASASVLTYFVLQFVLANVLGTFLKRTVSTELHTQS
jgi:bile acid:Na+ symporter, BASS family